MRSQVTEAERRKWREEEFTDDDRREQAALAAFVAWLESREHWVATTGYLESYNDAYVISERVEADKVRGLIVDYLAARRD